MNKLIDYRYTVVLFLAILVSFPFLTRGLFETSEGRYAMVAKTMNETGNYWMPKINGKDHLTKPPLTYWVIASGQKLFGENTFGSRFVHAVVWILLIMVMIRIGELMANKETGLMVGLIFTTAIFPSIGSWFLTTDPLLVFFQAISFWAILEYRIQDKSKWVYLFWISLGLAFNTKGPVALMPIIFWSMFYKRDIIKLCKLVPILFFIGISIFWYIGLEFKKNGILVELFQNEIIKRSTTDFSGRNAFWWAPIVSYFVPMLVGWGLWPFFIQKDLVQKTIQKKENLLLIVWIIATLCIFSFIQSRLILYILPLTIPMTLLLAQMLKEKNLFRPLVINLVIILAIKIFGTFYAYDNNAKQIADFARSTTKDEKVYFLNEYLYGVEFYLGPTFGRFPTHGGVFEALNKDKNHVDWVAYQDRRQDILDEIVKSYSKEVVEHKKLGKWNFVKLKGNAGLVDTSN